MIKHFSTGIHWWTTLLRKILWVLYCHGCKGSFLWILNLCPNITCCRTNVMNLKVTCSYIRDRLLSQNHQKEKLVKESNCSTTLMSYQKLRLNRSTYCRDTSKTLILLRVKSLTLESTWSFKVSTQSKLTFATKD